MTRLLVLAACVAVAACAAPVPVETVSGPNGKPAYVMNCSGFGRHRDDCLKKAGELCPAGYDVVDDNAQFAGAIVTKYAVLAANRNYMTVSCK